MWAKVLPFLGILFILALIAANAPEVWHAFVNFLQALLNTLG